MYVCKYFTYIYLKPYHTEISCVLICPFYDKTESFILKEECSNDTIELRLRKSVQVDQMLEFAEFGSSPSQFHYILHMH